MRKPTGRRPIQVVALATVLLLGLWQGAALAGPDQPAPPPAPDAQAPAPEPPAAPEPAPAPAPPAPSTSGDAPSAPQPAQLQPETPTDDDDSPGHETEDPQPPPHAAAQVAELVLVGGPLVTIGETRAEVDPEDGDSSRGDVTVLAIGGEEVVGAHSDSEGQEEADQGAQLLCEPSEGAICVGLLFAHTESREDADTSFSTADTELVFACVGGEQTQPEQTCSGPVGAGVSGSHSSITKDKATGNMTADSSSELADVCLGGEVELTGTCTGLGIVLIRSESHSEITDDNNNGTTEDDTGRTTRRSCVAIVEAGEEEAIALCGGDPELEGDVGPISIGVPPGEGDFPNTGCAEEALLCLFLNQGESFVFVGGAASRQEAVHIEVLRSGQVPGGQLVLGHLGTAETLVLGQPGEQIRVCPDPTNPDCPKPPPPCPPGFVRVAGECVPEPEITPRGGGPGVLALTGLGALPLVALSLILGTGGGSILAWDRRRRDTR